MVIALIGYLIRPKRSAGWPIKLLISAQSWCLKVKQDGVILVLDNTSDIILIMGGREREAIRRVRRLASVQVNCPNLLSPECLKRGCPLASTVFSVPSEVLDHLSLRCNRLPNQRKIGIRHRFVN